MAQQIPGGNDVCRAPARNSALFASHTVVQPLARRRWLCLEVHTFTPSAHLNAFASPDISRAAIFDARDAKLGFGIDIGGHQSD